MLTKILQKLKPQLFILIPFLVAFTADTNKSEYNVPLAVWSICSGDLNSDGACDIVTCHNFNVNTEWGGFTLMKNISNTSFKLDTLIKVLYTGYSDVQIIDINYDDSLDIVCLTNDGINIYFTVFLKENNAYLKYSYYTGQRTSRFVLNDVDSDGFVDVLFISNWDRHWGILYNQGDGTFSEPEYYDVEGYPPTDIACGDLDGDGRNDVVVSGGKLMIYYNTENGFISQQLSTQLTDVKISDFDSDGDNDIVIFNDVAIVGYTEILFFENTNNTGFQEHEEVLFSPSSSKFLIQDINRDQKPDLVFLSSFPFLGELGVVDTTGGIYIVYNQGNFELSGPQFVPVKNYSEHWRNFHCADFDGNGYLDFAVVKTLSIEIPSNLEILFNDGNGSFGQNPIVSVPNNGKSLAGAVTCYPNPFNSETILSVQQSQNPSAELVIYNLQGECIKRFSNLEMQDTDSNIVWNGTNQNGIPQPNGIYLVVLIENKQIQETFRIIMSNQ